MRATFPANAPKRQSPNPATDAAKKVTSPANAPIKSLAVEVAGVPAVAAEADTLAVAVAAEAKNATNVVRLVTLLAIAMKVVVEATKVVAVEVATVAAMAADTAVEVVVEAVAEAKPVTLVAGLVTCPGTALKARSATTVSEELCADSLCKMLTDSPGGEVGHLSRDCPSEPSSERVCYKCKQPGHVQASCPN